MLQCKHSFISDYWFTCHFFVTKENKSPRLGFISRWSVILCLKMLLYSVHCTARLQTVRRKVCETQEVTSCAAQNGKCIVFYGAITEKWGNPDEVADHPPPLKIFLGYLICKNAFSFTKHPERVGGGNLLFSGYRRSFPEVERHLTSI